MVEQQREIFPAENKLHAMQRRIELREIIAEIPDLLEKPPDQWFYAFAKKILEVSDNLNVFSPETQQYLTPVLKKALMILEEEEELTKANLGENLFEPLRNQPSPDAGPDAFKIWEQRIRTMRGVRSDGMIMEISRIMAETFEQELMPILEMIIPIEEIVAANPDVMKLTTEKHGSTTLKVLHRKHPFQNYWQRIPLPFDNTIAIKGGGARIINGTYAGSPPENIAAEIPQNDTDVVATGDQESARAKATLLGADPAGVEMKRGQLDYLDYASSRDMTINMSWVACDGLHTCSEAVLAAQTGITEISGNYRADKAIYNTDRFVWKDPQTGEKITLAKQRGISREVKAVAEGKIRGFTFIDINSNTPLAIYSLWLVKRWVKYLNNPDLPSEKFGDLLQRMYVLAKKMGHIPHGVNNVMELLELTHRDYPFFDIQKEMKDIVDEVRWKGKRLMKQIDREYSWATAVPSNLFLERKPGDTITRIITLDGHISDPELTQQIIEWYSGFVKRCQERTAHYNSLGLEATERYFFDLDTEPDPTDGDI